MKGERNMITRCKKCPAWDVTIKLPDDRHPCALRPPDNLEDCQPHTTAEYGCVTGTILRISAPILERGEALAKRLVAELGRLGE
jgi:hypothetical protein